MAANGFILERQMLDPDFVLKISVVWGILSSEEGYDEWCSYKSISKITEKVGYQEK